MEEDEESRKTTTATLSAEANEPLPSGVAMAATDLVLVFLLVVNPRIQTAYPPPHTDRERLLPVIASGPGNG
jgi:hypothetical protein